MNSPEAKWTCAVGDFNMIGGSWLNDGETFGCVVFFEERETKARAAGVSRWAHRNDLKEITTTAGAANNDGMQTRRRRGGQRGSQLDYVSMKRDQCAEMIRAKLVQNIWDDFDHAQIVLRIKVMCIAAVTPSTRRP